MENLKKIEKTVYDRILHADIVYVNGRTIKDRWNDAEIHFDISKLNDKKYNISETQLKFGGVILSFTEK